MLRILARVDEGGGEDLPDGGTRRLTGWERLFDPQKPVTADLVAHEKEVQACPMIMAKVKKEH